MAGDTAADHQRITLRIPPGLHLRLIGEAERNGRSLNAEVVARLEASEARGASCPPARAVPGLETPLATAESRLELCRRRQPEKCRGSCNTP